MNSEQKIMLIKYLNLEGDVGNFLTGDLFQELRSLINIDTCINDENIMEKIRNENKENALDAIKTFLEKNGEYQELVDFHFGIYDMIDIYEHLLMGYVFYFSSLSHKYRAIDIFKDRRSILYSDGPAIYEIIC